MTAQKCKKKRKKKKKEKLQADFPKIEFPN